MKGALTSLDVTGKKVIVRVDFNVPLDKQFKVTDDTRIRGAIPTIQYLLEHGAAVIILSHFGRPAAKLLPSGEIDKAKFTLQHIVPSLSALLGKPVQFYPDIIGNEVQHQVSTLKAGEILMLENTRFYAGEEKGDPELAKQLASLGEVYINDAFGAAHRAHASTTVMANYFDVQHKGFGFLMQKELDNAKKVLNKPQSPFIAILGGAKVSDKILLIESLLDKADKIQQRFNQ